MTEIVISENEVALGTTLFPIKGGVRSAMISVFPGKVVIGDYTKDDEQLASSLIFSDQRGGILKEEMDEKVDFDRAYWSTLNTRYKGHLPLPVLATDCGGTSPETLRPNATGDEAVLTPYPDGGEENYEDVDEVTTDEDTTYVTEDGAFWGRDLYNIGASSMASGTIDSVTVYARCKVSQLADQASLKIACKSGSTIGEGDEETLTTSYVNYSKTWTLNPDTSSAWTVSEINSLQVGVSLREPVSVGGGNSRCTQVYVKVAYSGKDAYIIFDDGTDVYACFDKYLRKFDNDNTDFNDVEKEFSYNPTDAISFNGAIFVGFGSSGKMWQRGIPTSIILNPKFDDWTGSNPNNWTKSGSGDIAQNTDPDYIEAGAYSAKLSGSASVELYQDLPWSTALQGKEITLTAYGYKTSAGSSTMFIEIDDGVGPDSTSFDGIFRQKTVTRTLNANATRLRISVEYSYDQPITGYCDKFEISMTDSSPWIQPTGQFASYFTIWNDALYKIDYEGYLSYTTDGNTWTSAGKLTEPFGTINSLFIDRDQDGAMVIYAGTTKGTFQHDNTNSRFIATELQLPEHPTSALGTCHFREGRFISAGLDILKYIAARTATIQSVGLDRDDGLPADFQGEITKLIKGYNEFYALVDPTYVTGTQYGSVMAYDGLGWQCTWLSGTANKAMKTGMVSSCYSSYRLYWGANNKIYYIPLERNLRNPRKISTFNYGAAGKHLYPNFDAGTAHDKLAVRAKIECDKITTNETVIFSYRINHANTDVDTGWDTLATLDTTAETGKTEHDFGSSAGIVFRDIQFRLDLARGGTPTLTPDVMKLSLSYLKLLKVLWGWSFEILCYDPNGGGDYKNKTPDQLDAALKTLVETQTLFDFTFRDESGGTYSYKCRIARCQGLERTGENWYNRWQIDLVAP